jgi:hypothetical protein
MGGKLKTRTRTACRSIEMASHCFHASHPITTYSYPKVQHDHEFAVFFPTSTKSALIICNFLRDNSLCISSRLTCVGNHLFYSKRRFYLYPRFLFVALFESVSGPLGLKALHLNEKPIGQYDK